MADDIPSGCYPTPLSTYGINVQNSAMYMGVAAGVTSLYYQPASTDTQQKIVSALAAGAVTAIVANVVGWMTKSYFMKCR